MLNECAGREVDIYQERYSCLFRVFVCVCVCVFVPKGWEAEGVLAASPGRVITALLLPC